MIDRLATLLLTRPRAVLLVWLLIVLASVPSAARLGGVLTTDIGFAPGGSAERTSDILSSAFSGSNGRDLLLVSEGDGPAFEATLSRVAEVPAVTDVRELDLADRVADVPETLRVGVARLDTASDAESTAALEAIQAIGDERSTDLLVTGPPAIDLELKRISARDTRRAELIGLPLSLAVLVYVFGSLVAAILPLLAAVVSITVSLGLLTVLGAWFPIATFAQIIVSMLGLAVGIDYALLLVNRFREELRRGLDVSDALRTTLRTAGRAVLFSGATVLLALASLLVPPLAFVRSFGAAAMITLVLGMAVAITLVPAMLALLGRRVDTVRVARRAPGTRSRAFWRSWTRAILHYPLRWTIGASIALIAVAAPAFTMRLGVSGADGITGPSDARNAEDRLVEAGLGGYLEPYEVLLDVDPRGFFHPSSVRAVDRFSSRVTELPEVAGVLGPTGSSGLPFLFELQYLATREAAMDSPLADLVAASVSADDRYVRLQVILRPGANPSADLEARIRAAAADLDPAVLVGGVHVAEREWAEALYGDVLWIVLAVIVATFVLLGLAFRSIALPLKSLVLNLFTVGSAFGVITLVFQDGVASRLFGLAGGLGFVETSVPLVIFAVVFGLSMDYEVFLVSRIVEAHHRGLPDREAVIEALSATGGVITSAAAIMLVVFSVFLISDVVLIKTLALGLSVAVLLDATIVRSILVPSSVVLLGAWNWRVPTWLGRWIDRIGLRHD